MVFVVDDSVTVNLALSTSLPKLNKNVNLL